MTSALASPYVDLESLLWELRDLVRGLGQMNAAQAAALTKLGAPVSALDLDAEYADRTHAALISIDAALDQLQFQPQVVDNAGSSEISTDNEDDAHIVAWINDVHVASVQPSAPVSVAEPEPSDFWTTESFNWDDEPEIELASPTGPFEEDAPQPISDDIDYDDLVSPWDSISMLGVDESDSDNDSSTGNDSATLFLSPANPVQPSKFGASSEGFVMSALYSDAVMSHITTPALVV